MVHEEIGFLQLRFSTETLISSRHTIESRREISVNFGQFRGLVSQREINELSFSLSDV